MSRVLAANWKMNLTVSEARTLYAAIADAGKLHPEVTTIVFPPFTALAALAPVRVGGGPALGAQNCHAEPRGAFTGEISAEQVRDAGAEYVLAGHSERRRLFCENDLIVRAKVGAAWRAGLTPILCIGETLAERERRETQDILARQLARALEGAPARVPLLVAYEPVWAIGTGVVATPDQVAEAHGWVQAELQKLRRLGSHVSTPVLYGGSVDPKNAGPLAGLPEVDGFLVGGASLSAPGFLAIAGALAAAAVHRPSPD
ncbi:MAG TPA: triose-phosphate isomerase [Candidatus Eisenbacteria bacterium]